MRGKLYIVVLAVLSSGCFIDTIKPEELLDYQEKVVVNGVLTTQGGISLEITDSRSSFDSIFPKLIRDAEVVVIQNQLEIPLTFDLFSEQYVANNKLEESDAITLSVKHPDFPFASSILRMPRSINASATLIEDGAIDTSGNITDLVEVTFEDQPGTKNFYVINFYYRNETLNQYIPIAFPTTDPSLAEYNSFLLNNAGVLFTDDLFNGSTKTISLVPVADLVSGNTGDKYKVELMSVTEDLFKYYKSLQRAQDAREISFDAGYNNAVVIHSNIRNGLGILGGATVNELILN